MGDARRRYLEHRLELGATEPVPGPPRRAAAAGLHHRRRRRIDRDIGYALVRAGGSEAPDLVVFAEPGDMVLLGAHSLEGLNVKIDPVKKELFPAGPVIAAAARFAAAW